MSKTAFSNKCSILGDLWLYYRTEAESDYNWNEFFVWADIALPLAHMLDQNYVKIDGKGNGDIATKFIEDAWTTFCEIIAIDPDAKYSNLGECWEASPNGPKVEVKEMKM
jgi:hypothetical protein